MSAIAAWLSMSYKPFSCALVVWWSYACFGLFVPLALYSQDDPIAELKPGEWLEVPNTRMESVAPDPLPGGYFAGIMDAWSGGAYDTKRDRLLIWGGGHSDYAGNEIYAFDVNTLKWERLTEPSIPPGKDAPYALDGNPTSRHTYDYIQYVPDIDCLCSFGGAGFWITGQKGTSNVDCYDFVSQNWKTRLTTVPANGGSGFIGSFSAYDPVARTIWIGKGKLFAYDPINRTWIGETEYSNDIEWNNELTMTEDPLGRVLVGAGGGKVYTWDISDTHSQVAPQELKTAGDKEVVNKTVGLEYDPVSDRIIAWAGGRNVYSLNLDTRIWEKHTGSGADPGPANSNGTYGRFRYVASRNVFVLVNRVGDNVFFYRHMADMPTSIQLVMFGGEETNGRVTLKWKTTPLPNSRGFVVERRNENSHFRRIGYVEGLIISSQEQGYTFIDRSVQASETYIYRLKQANLDGGFEYSQEVSVTVKPPEEFGFIGNYPNPFNPVTKIRFEIPVRSTLTLSVFDINGKVVRTLLDREVREPGVYSVSFDASDLSSGTYFYCLQAPGAGSETAKMLLLK